ncbi:MAG: GNVR domain-containing protein [Pseudomonadales bacterium]
MQEAFDRYLSLLHGCWRFRWWGSAAAWIVAVVGWLVVAAIPNQYEATAKVYVDTESFLEPLLAGITVDSMDVGEKMALVATRLMSRPVLERVALDSDLGLSTTGEAGMGEIIASLRGKVNVEAQQLSRVSWPPRPPNLYTLGARDENPERALLIVRSLLDAFVEDAIGSTKQDTGAATEFLQKQIAEYEVRLLKAEQRLTEFRQANMDSLPERGQDYFARLRSERELLATTELELREQQFRLRSLQAQLRGVNPVQRSVSPDGTIVLSPLEERVNSMEQRLDELLLQYTESHPEVVSLKNSLEQLRRKAAESESTSSSPGSATNPMYQELRLQLGQVEANIAAITVRRDEYLRRIDALQGQVETLPQIEAELAALNRDYEITQTNYNELVGRLESAELRTEANRTGQNVNFRIVEPPVLPAVPFFPNRLMFSALATLLAMLVGVGVAFLMSQINPVIGSTARLAEVFGRPVIGSVSSALAISSGALWRMDLRFVMAIALLFAAYLVVAISFLQGFQLALL